MPEMIPVASSLIKAVGFNEEKEELHVEFHKGGEYLYQGVSRHVFEALIDAHSAGAFFLKNVKYQYECIKVS